MLDSRNISLNDPYIIDTRGWKWFRKLPSATADSIQFTRGLGHERLGRRVKQAHEQERAVHGLRLGRRQRLVFCVTVELRNYVSNRKLHLA